MQGITIYKGKKVSVVKADGKIDVWHNWKKLKISLQVKHDLYRSMVDDIYKKSRI